MARAARLPEMLRAVPLDLALGDDVGLADEAGPQASGLDLMPKGRSRQPKIVGGFRERQHRSVLRHGLALALPDAVMARLTGVDRAGTHFGFGRIPIEGASDWEAATATGT